MVPKGKDTTFLKPFFYYCLLLSFEVQIKREKKKKIATSQTGQFQPILAQQFIHYSRIIWRKVSYSNLFCIIGDKIRSCIALILLPEYVSLYREGIFFCLFTCYTLLKTSGFTDEVSEAFFISLT